MRLPLTWCIIICKKLYFMLHGVRGNEKTKNYQKMSRMWWRS
jgi:hypothetical protein